MLCEINTACSGEINNQKQVSSTHIVDSCGGVHSLMREKHNCFTKITLKICKYRPIEDLMIYQFYGRSLYCVWAVRWYMRDSHLIDGQKLLISIYVGDYELLRLWTHISSIVRNYECLCWWPFFFIFNEVKLSHTLNGGRTNLYNVGSGKIKGSSAHLSLYSNGTPPPKVFNQKIFHGFINFVSRTQNQRVLATLDCWCL